MAKNAERWWTAKEVELVRRWQLEGVSYAEQAGRLGRTTASLFGAIKRYGLQGHPYQARGSDTRAALMRSIAEGKGIVQIAREAGVHPSRMRFLAREMVRRKALRKEHHRKFVVTNGWTQTDDPTARKGRKYGPRVPKQAPVAGEKTAGG